MTDFCWQPPEHPGEEADAPLKSKPGERSVFTLLELVNQFDVEKAKRYSRRDFDGDGRPETWCNRFTCDVARAMGVELPYRKVTDLLPWLSSVEGKDAGWREVDEATARGRACIGELSLVVWVPTGPHDSAHGHIAVVVPPLPHEPPSITWIAQAGRVNFKRGSLVRGFGARRLRYFTHP